MRMLFRLNHKPNFFFFFLFYLIIGCEKSMKLDENVYSQITSHRNFGLAYLEEERYSDAANEFLMLIEKAPKEPLGYANLGLTYMRMDGELKQSEKWINSALNLVPKNPDIRFLLAKIYEMTNRRKKALNIILDVVGDHSNHVPSLFQLSLYLMNDENGKIQQSALKYLTKLTNSLSGNIAAEFYLIESLLNNNENEKAFDRLSHVQQILPMLSDQSKKLIYKIFEFLRDGNTADAYASTIMLHNLIKPKSIYQASLNKLRGTNGPIAGAPIYSFLYLEKPVMKNKYQIPRDITFTNVSQKSGLIDNFSKKINGSLTQSIIAIGDYDSDGDLDLFASNWSKSNNTSSQYLLENNRGKFTTTVNTLATNHKSRDLYAIFADYDNNGYLDLFILNEKDNRLYQNFGEGEFEPINDLGIVHKQNGFLATFVDLDLEGDLDLFLATDSVNYIYRNNSDGTFNDIGEDSGIVGSNSLATDIIYCDFDNDGDVDLFILNGDGKHEYYNNLRRSNFKNITSTSGLVHSTAGGFAAAGDYNNDGAVDIFIADVKGKEHLLYKNQGDGTFELDPNWVIVNNSMQKIYGKDVAFLDADNDGYLDILIAGRSDNKQKNETGLRLLYNNGLGEFLDASSLIPDSLGSINKIEIGDFDNDGDEDIFFVNHHGQIQLLRNDGGNINNFLKIRLTGLRTGSSKNNYFGIGSRVEVRAGYLYQVRYVDSPIISFGLGSQPVADVVRVLWSNGVPQNRFKPQSNQTIVETQILKGSCPYLFGWNGSKYEFITDVLWPSALGMPLGIMAGEPMFAFPNSTDEYLKIGENNLKIKDGSYFLQFTTELWETPYLDKVKILAIDHPIDVNVEIDETFIPPPYPSLRIYNFKKKYFPVKAYDHLGRDVLDEISIRDKKYISNLNLGLYQGITELQDLTLVFKDLNNSDSLFLFLNGWLFPTDASINVNISQSNKNKLIFPMLQVPDSSGEWITIMDNISFPKGKNKTMVVNLTDKFLSDDYRIRIRTNMQIYWDHIFITKSGSGNQLNIATLKPISADLHYRGFSHIKRKDFHSPHIPDYYSITTGQKWRDLTGFYTRYGDVLSLLLESDDKYVIMNAGDEIRLEFAASSLAEIKKGWNRTFIFYNDGWLKDGDLNTAEGQTVKPLPFHGMKSYPYEQENILPSNQIEYNNNYNTREVTADGFKQSIN
ncbi:MAG: hypothetical protein CMG69_03365 [Candidatus Marinimicrobia bacterium]|nr:hypothetical protein [Candidatus Neomarinimicrobiota bacterium]